MGAELARDVTPPLVAAAASRRLVGNRAGFGALGWVGFGAGAAYSLARTRDDAQRGTRELWARRSRGVLAEQRVASRVQAGLAHNLVQDPKSMLMLLELAGSTRAAEVRDELDDDTGSWIGLSAGGTTLVHAMDGFTIEPVEDRTRWVADQQIHALRTAIARIDQDRPVDGEGSGFERRMTVERTWGSTMTVRYRDEVVSLERPLPELAIRLEPTIPALAVGLVWTALAATPQLGRAPLRVVAPALAIESAALARLLANPAHERSVDRVTLGLVAAGAVLVDAGAALSQQETSRAGSALCPGTGATQALMLLLAANWGSLGRERWTVGVVGLCAWAASMAVPGHRRWATYVNELAFLFMPALAAASMGADARREADALDDDLDRWLASSLDDEARAVATTAVERYVHYLRAVVEELPKWDVGLDSGQIQEMVDLFTSEISRLQHADPLSVINW